MSNPWNNKEEMKNMFESPMAKTNETTGKVNTTNKRKKSKKNNNKRNDSTPSPVEKKTFKNGRTTTTGSFDIEAASKYLEERYTKARAAKVVRVNENKKIPMTEVKASNL
eukprot:CAMPEP_0117427818 /NCGR_PEP_ID=MMETSP0758-20121206/7610_1 /TAXON_ID=63605 /ORGANISM="Percolomonas cosmopolitus, Strain AE-1 (ATCC 50343)" /LENGTH=109 /DNA_ID=CAMNT_0005213723 /DNA_START=48 /DNA_END=374 /DNA_ORIENTATION=+